jgi:hemoglobin-like flavoprotein
MALNVELLETSFALVDARAEEFTDAFYGNLLGDFPEAAPLFAAE